MKDPHNTSEYTALDGESDVDKTTPSASEISAQKPPEAKGKRKKQKFSGAYYYVDEDEKKLAEQSFIRTVLTVSAFFLQIVILFLPAQDSLEYVTHNLTSYAFFYVMTVFVMIGVSVWLMIMNTTRYKFRKRIPVEYAPKHGFGRRAFFGNELYIAVNALLTVMQISFVCIVYDAVTLIAVFLSAAATAAAAAARQITHITLRNSELIPAAPEDPEE